MSERVSNAHDGVALRFWAKVGNRNGEGCWPWKAALFSAGYGAFKLRRGKQVKAHRMAWFLTHGRWPMNMLCHRCNNPVCVNPSHLYDGTHADNMADRSRKKRSQPGYIPPKPRIRKERASGNHLPGKFRVGESHPLSKLTEVSVREIRAAYAAGERPSAIGRRYCIALNTVLDVTHRRTWVHVL